MGEVYSHLSEEERQVIQIEIGNGTGIRAIGAMIGRSPSTVCVLSSCYRPVWREFSFRKSGRF
nr:helix-turn-helix domain-containing protein [Bifidobacterium bifidum]